MITYAVIGSPFMALVALPLVTLMYRSFRHAQLVDASRVDGKTGLLNASTWQPRPGWKPPGPCGPGSARCRHRRHRSLQGGQ